MSLFAKDSAALSPNGESRWQEYLAAQLTNDWKVGAWDATTGVLTIDPFNELNDFSICKRPGCANPAARVPYCQGCVRRARKAGLPVEEYASTHVKVDPRAARSTRGFVLCEIRDEAGDRCGRAQSTRGLCSSHYMLLRKRCRAGGSPVTDELLSAFLADRRGKILHPSIPCRVPSCERVLSARSANGLCEYHDSGFRAVRRLDRTITVEGFVALRS